MAEEVRNADVVVPWSMVGTTLLNGTLGFAMIIAVLFVTLDIDSALESPTGSMGLPFMDIFLTNTSRGGATGMIIIIILIVGGGIIAFVATTSRLIWAFARDQAFPGWRHVSKVAISRPSDFRTLTACDRCNRTVRFLYMLLSSRLASP